MKCEKTWEVGWGLAENVEFLEFLEFLWEDGEKPPPK